MKRIIKSMPNLITITRIIMTLLFVCMIIGQFIYGQERGMSLSILFLYICISDLLDSKIARKTNSVSIVGA